MSRSLLCFSALALCLYGCDRGSLECELPATSCGDYCANLQADSGNCGACGITCGADETCRAGKCEVCPEGGCSAGTVFAACFNTGELVGLDDNLNPVGTSLAIGAGPQALAHSGASLLVGDAIDNALYSLDPRQASLQKAAGADRLGKATNQVLVHAGRAYAINSGENAVQVIDLALAAPAQIDSSRTVDQIPTKAGDPASELNTNPTFGAFAGDKLYVSLGGTCDETGHQAGNRLLELDVSKVPGTVAREMIFDSADLEHDATVDRSSARPAGIASLGNTLYVAIGNLNTNCVGSAGPGYLAVVDTTEPHLSPRYIKLPASCRNPAYVLATDDRVFVSCPGSYGYGEQPDEALVVIDVATEEIVHTQQLPRCDVSGSAIDSCRTAVPGRLALHGDRLLVADNNAGRLFATDLDGKLVPGLESGVQLCQPKCYGEGTDCYQFTSDVLSFR